MFNALELKQLGVEPKKSKTATHPAPAIAAPQPTPTKESDMPKQRTRASPEEARQHDDAVFKFIDAAADPVARAEISQSAQIEDLGAVGRAIKRLAAAKRIRGVGRGPAVKWTTKPVAGKAAKATPKKKKDARSEPPPPSATNGYRFGYFSDGSLSIDCPGCSGTLTQEALRALRDFTKRFEGAQT